MPIAHATAGDRGDLGQLPRRAFYSLVAAAPSAVQCGRAHAPGRQSTHTAGGISFWSPRHLRLSWRGKGEAGAQARYGWTKGARPGRRSSPCIVQTCWAAGAGVLGRDRLADRRAHPAAAPADSSGRHVRLSRAAATLRPAAGHARHAAASAPACPGRSGGPDPGRAGPDAGGRPGASAGRHSGGGARGAEPIRGVLRDEPVGASVPEPRSGAAIGITRPPPCRTCPPGAGISM